MCFGLAVLLLLRCEECGCWTSRAARKETGWEKSKRQQKIDEEYKSCTLVFNFQMQPETKSEQSHRRTELARNSLFQSDISLFSGIIFSFTGQEHV